LRVADPDLSLERRAGLPDSLRVLLERHPRDGWTADPGFQGLIAFWLARHQAFRDLTAQMRTDVALVRDRRTDPDRFASRLAQLGSRFVNELHGHHQIEDQHYFPILAAKEPRILHGFTMLDQDHHALDGHIDRFVKGANAILRRRDEPAAFQTATGRFGDDLTRFSGFLERHLTDEEDLIVPVILRHGAASLE
jgi:iron-sulfur cluster repair protein YtfE (RIC family)